MNDMPMFTEGAPISSPERRRQRLAGGVLQPHLDFLLWRELGASTAQEIASALLRVAGSMIIQPHRARRASYKN